MNSKVQSTTATGLLFASWYRRCLPKVLGVPVLANSIFVLNSFHISVPLLHVAIF
jgi:hypothetical protein